MSNTATVYSLKELVIAVLTVLAGLVNAYLWKGVILSGTFHEVWFYSLPVAALLAFTLFFALAAAFIQQALIRNSAAVLSLATSYLLVPYNPAVLPPLAITALGAWFAAGQISKESQTANHFSSRRILKSGTPIFFTVLALVFTFFYYTSILGEEEHVFIPRQVFEIIVPYLEQPLGNVLPGLEAGTAVDDILLSIVAQGTDASDLSQMPKEERDKLIREARRALESQLGITVSGREKGSDIFYQVTNAQIERFLGPFKKYIPLIAAAGFFIAVRAFAIPIYWITLLLMPVVVRFLTIIGFLKEQNETIQIVRIIL